MDPRRFAARLSQAAEVLQGKWRLGQWPNGQSEQQERVVVGGRPVEVDDLARQATVDEDPLAAAANRDGDRLHRRPAVGVPVARDVIVEVAAPQAVGAVIAVVGAGGVQGDVEPAVPAAECLAGGVVAALGERVDWTTQDLRVRANRTGRRAPELDGSGGGEARHDEVHRRAHRSPPLIARKKPPPWRWSAVQRFRLGPSNEFRSFTCRQGQRTPGPHRPAHGIGTRLGAGSPPAYADVGEYG